MPKFHFFSALLVILGLKEDKKLLVISSCTEELQSFHHPLKKQKSAPIKAEHLGKGESEQCDPDPRPDHLKNRPSYQDEVNMRTVNYCSNNNRDSMWRYKFGKADIQAAADDHRYEKLPITEI